MTDEMIDLGRVLHMNAAGFWFADWLREDASRGTLAEWVTALLGIVVLIVALLSGRSAWKQWKTQHLVAEWYKTLDFLFANSRYLDPTKNEKYRESYSGVDAIEYDLVARRSIAYVDDLYHFGLGKHLASWLRGAVPVFVRPHLVWLTDNKDSYSRDFFETVTRELESK